MRSIADDQDGAFASMSLPSASPEASTSADGYAYVSSEKGNSTVQIRIPGAVWTQNRAIARASDGAIAVCGSAKDAVGHPWSYLAVFPADGATPLVVHTEPYNPTGIAFAPDGTVWMKGAEHRESRYLQSSPNGLLRHFDRSGALIGEALPQARFTDPQATWGDTIAAAAGRVGWVQYHGFGSGRQPQGGSYFEVLTDRTVTQTPLPRFAEGEAIDSLALTDNGYALMQKSVNGVNPTLYSLDRRTGIWRPMRFPPGFPDASYWLLGATGNTAAFWMNSPPQTALLVNVK